MVNAEDDALVGQQEVDLPQRLVVAEPRAGRHVGQVVVHRGLVVVVVGGHGTVEDDEMAVQIDVGPAPALSAGGVADHEAAEPGVSKHDRAAHLGLHGLHVDGVLQPHGAVYYLVNFGSDEEPAGRC